MLSSECNLTIGFIGCGKIGAAVATGYATVGKGHKIIVTRRSQEKSAALAAKFPDCVTVTDDYSDIVTACDVVFLGLLPGVARELLPTLDFSKVKMVVSMMAAINYEETLRLLPTVSSADAVNRIVPLPSASRHVGPILSYPVPAPAPAGSFNIVHILTQVGTAISCKQESEMLPLISITGHISSFYELMNVTQQWAVKQNVGDEAAQKFVAAFYSSLSGYALSTVTGTEAPLHLPFQELAEEAATPGGLNAQSLAHLRSTPHYALQEGSLDAILHRLNPAAVPAPAAASSAAAGDKA